MSKSFFGVDAVGPMAPATETKDLIFRSRFQEVFVDDAANKTVGTCDEDFHS